VTGRRRDGSIFPIEISLTQIATADGGHSLAFISDVTSRRQAERELADSHAALQERTIELQDRTTELERRTVQLSRLASELTLAEQRTRGELAKMLHDGLQQVLFSASLKLAQLQDHRRRALIADPLMDEARAEVDEAMAAARTLSVELAPPDVIAARLVPAANWLAGWMRTKYGLIVRVAADPDVDVTAKDVRTLLFQSLREILFNVVKHAGVSYADVKLAAGAGDTLVITVADRGVGFDPALLDDPQLDRDNAGFGILSIRERLTLLGGRLEVEAAPGRGAEFRLIAPRATVPPLAYVAGAVAAQRAAAVSPNKTAPLRVLLVDDHPELLQAVRIVLGEHDEFAVIGEARNGMEAIAQARALRPDVVLMDVSMPVMNGVDATQSIHAELPWIQILGLSTYEKREDPHPIELAGAVGYFQKGVDMRRLIDHLRAMQSSARQYSAR
jgi:signal transduction histidine kinase